MKIRSLLLTLVAALSFGAAGCDFGTVDQGRVVAYDDNTKTVTFVQDVKHDQFNPDYSGEVVTFKMPVDPKEIGPLPKAGHRVLFEIEKGTIDLYDPATKSVSKVPVEFTDVQKGVKTDSPLVKGKKFPIIDKEKGTVTEYSKRLSSLITFKVPADMLSMPDETWEAGDEVRVYYKEKGQALRFMNVSKTNIYKK